MSDVAEKFRIRACADEDILEDIMRRLYTQFMQGEAAFSMIDGGAHRGMHTYPMSRLPNCRRVYAVEANQTLAADLKHESAKVKGGAEIVVVAAAVQQDSERKQVTFMRSDSHSGRSGISSIFQNDPEVSFVNTTVPATTIDLLAADRRAPVRFIKLDLEGGEWNAVRGSAEVMAKDSPIFVMEHSVYSPEINGYAPEEYLELWRERGYQPLTFAGAPMTVENMHYLWYVWAAPQAKADVVAAALAEQASRNG